VDAEQCFAKLPSTDIALQTTVYYYSLQIASSLDWHGDNDEKNCLSGVYRTSPGSLSTAVVTYISWALSDPVVGTQMSASVHQMALRLMHYNCRLIELTQAQALRRLDRGEFVDTNINLYKKNLKSFITVKAHCSMTHLKQQKSFGLF